MSRMKSWMAQVKKLGEKREKHLKQIAQLQKECDSMSGKIDILNDKIKKLQEQEITLSPHAIDRYRERIDENTSPEEILSNLVTDELRLFISVLNEGVFPIDRDSGITVVVKDNTIISCWK